MIYIGQLHTCSDESRDRDMFDTIFVGNTELEVVSKVQKFHIERLLENFDIESPQESLSEINALFQVKNGFELANWHDEFQAYWSFTITTEEI